MNQHPIHRRKFLATSASALMGSAFATDEVPPRPIGIPLEQEPLAFDLHALEPYLDAATLRLHYHEHHALHLMELKQALSSVELSVASVSSLMPCIRSMPKPAVERRSILQFGAMNRGTPVKSVSQKLPQEVQDCIRHSGGAHVNHTAFWRFLNPPKSGHLGPQGKAAMHIEKEFGTVHEFKAAFTEAALNHEGSGWAWLQVQEQPEEVHRSLVECGELEFRQQSARHRHRHIWPVTAAGRFTCAPRSQTPPSDPSPSR
jgi:Fe-Mn family superoxide dismutase